MIVFVSGPPRSGTTLLNGLLSGGTAHPMLPECTLMTSVIRHRLNYSVRNDPKRLTPYVGNDEAFDQLTGRQLEEMVQHIESTFAAPRSILVLKDPFLVFVLNELSRFFHREIRTICIVRDPRDVVASLAAVFARERGDYKVTHLIAGLLPFYAAVAEAFPKQPGASCPKLLIRYEDLVDPHTGALDRIEDFCGYAIDRTGYREVAPGSLDRSSPWFVDTYGCPMRSDRVGKFAEALSPHEITLVETAFDATLKLFGYQ